MTALLLAALCQAAPLSTPALLDLLAARRVAVDSNAAARAAAEAVARLADPGALFFDESETAAFEAALAGSTGAPPVLTELGEGIVRLRVPVLNAAAAALTATGLAQAAVAGGGFILDCRGATGADLACVDAIAGHFTEPDTFLYAVQDGAGEDLELHAAPAAARAAVPALMLVDGETRGAAELLAALFEAPRGVLLVGSRTRGDAARRETVPLGEGRLAFLATGRFVRPDGSTWQGKGVTPHVAAPDSAGVGPEIRTNAAFRSGQPLDDFSRRHLELFARVRGDAVLARAVDLLLGLKALAIFPETSHALEPSAADRR